MKSNLIAKRRNPRFLGWTEGRDGRNERDYKAMVHAARQGRIEVHTES
jgi:hypothetical protein